MLTKYKIYEVNPFLKDTEFDDNSFQTLMNLKDHSLRLLHYLSYTARKNRLRYMSNPLEDDFEIHFDIDDANKRINRSNTSIYKSIRDLERHNVIARTKKHQVIFINPKFLIHGTNKRLKR